MVSKVGSVMVRRKTKCEQQVAELTIRQENREYKTYLPRGVYSDLDKSLILMSDKNFKLELLDDLVQLIPTQEAPIARVQFNDGRVFNCYRGLVYDDVYMKDDANIELHPDFVLLIGLNGESIRVLRSVKGFKKLGSPVALQTLC